MFVKICGLTDRAAIDTAVVAGADALGFVFAASPRRTTPERAAALCRGLPAHLIRVAVMRHPDPAEWLGVRDEFAPDWLQTDAEDFEMLELGATCEALPVYRSGQAKPGAKPARMLYEGPRSGRGEVADWAEARSLAGETRVVLAGGLDAENVAAAIDAVAPWGVDVSSGVESAPGEKDPEKIERFIARAKATEIPA